MTHWVYKKSNIFSEENKSKLKNWKTRLLNKKQDLKFKNNGIFSFIGNVGDGFYLNTGVYHRGQCQEIVIEFYWSSHLVVMKN